MTDRVLAVRGVIYLWGICVILNFRALVLLLLPHHRWMVSIRSYEIAFNLHALLSLKNAFSNSFEYTDTFILYWAIQVIILQVVFIPAELLICICVVWGFWVWWLVYIKLCHFPGIKRDLPEIWEKHHIITPIFVACCDVVLLVFQIKQTRIRPDEVITEIPHLLEHLRLAVHPQEIIFGFNEASPPGQLIIAWYTCI